MYNGWHETYSSDFNYQIESVSPDCHTTFEAFMPKASLQAQNPPKADSHPRRVCEWLLAKEATFWGQPTYPPPQGRVEGPLSYSLSAMLQPYKRILD